jgi:hypothetical protein
MSPLHRLTKLFRGRDKASPVELRSYGQVVIPIAGRLENLYTRWRQDLELVSAEDELANAASIRRWEAAGLLDRLRPIQPPPPLTRTHNELEAVITDTARASQLLSNGYRFTSSRARCDGQALMLECQERFEALRRSMQECGVREADDRRRTIYDDRRRTTDDG